MCEACPPMRVFKETTCCGLGLVRPKEGEVTTALSQQKTARQGYSISMSNTAEEKEILTKAGYEVLMEAGVASLMGRKCS